MKNKSDFAPVAIITCNRVMHLKECITSLRKCALADKTELFISVDYPPSKKYEQGYKELVEYLRGGIDGFKKVNVYFQEKNLGPELNNYWIEDKVFEKYDRVIYSEDDNIFSPNFLVYMNKCLDKNENNKKCYCICAHQYPVDLKYGNNTVLTMNNDFDSWGYAVWEDRIIEARKYIREKAFIDVAYDNKQMYKLLRMNSKLFCYYVDNLYNDTQILKSDKYISRMVDVSISINLIFQNMFVLVPSINKVRNKGWDGSGTNCPIDNSQCDWAKQEYDQSNDFEYIYAKNQDNVQHNYVEIKKYHKIGFIHIAKRIVMLMAFRIRGKHDKVYQK